MRRVLNVGGNSKRIALPAHFQGWEHLLLDIDPTHGPDLVCDARQLTTLPAAQFDAVYCSHNLEHYYRHDAVKVLAGFLHVLTEDGFAHIRVPDIGALIREVAARDLDLDDFLYESPAGPILVRDVIWGYGVEIERSGQDFFAHKTGFTRTSLAKLLSACGFSHVFLRSVNIEVIAFAFRHAPRPSALRMLGLMVAES